MQIGIGIGLANGQAGTDPDASVWAAAVTAAGGTYSQSTLGAVSTFTRAAKSAGYWSKLTRINLFCGNQLAAALVPLKVGGGNATDTNFNFVSGDYTEATGLTGNTTTKYLDTGLNVSTLTLNDTHMAVYNRSSVLAAVIPIGATDGTNFFQMLAPFTDGKLYSDQYIGTTGRVSSSVFAGPFGFLVGSRTAAAAHAVYRNGASIGSNATSGGALFARSVYVFAQNNVGTPASWSNYPLGAYSIGAGLTAAEVTAYNTHMQACMTALGRNV